jgi:hypothetical protein
MNYVDIELDAYEIANRVFDDENEIDKNISFDNIDVETFFEMLLIITIEGIKKFYGDEFEKIDLTKLDPKDIDKINSYLKKIFIILNFKIFDIMTYNILNNNLSLRNYKEIDITNNTRLNKLNYVVIREDLNLVYIFNFDYLNSF